MSFRSKTIIGITVIQAVILFSIIWNAQILMRQALETELHQRAATAAGLFVTTTKDAVLSMDLASLESFVKEVMKNPDIVYARVLDTSNRVLAAAGPQDMLARPFEQDDRFTLIDDGVFDTFAEIAEAGIIYGRVEVGVSIRTVLGDLEDARSRIVRIALFEIALSILLSVLLGFYLSRQLYRLKEASERITAGDIGYQIETKGKDEIGITAKAFNQMSLHLKDSLTEISAKKERLEEEAKKRHETEALLQKSYDQLEKRVAERTAELAKANAKLKVEMEERLSAEKKKQELEAQLQRSRKMEALGELAGGVAHDLNNVLSGIMSYPELLLLDLDPDSHLREPIETIRNSGKKASAIVQDLLTLARRGVMAAEVLNINNLVHEYLNSPEHDEILYKHPQLKIKTDLAGDLLNIEGSPVHLCKTLMNLVSNAAEAMPDGGEVLIRSENKYVDTPIKGYDAITQGDFVVLSVIDQGKGISPKDQERIFEPFFTKKNMGRSSGSGLGLAVVWGTVKDHNGYIDIHSTVGEGSTISIYFPCSRRAPKTASDACPMDTYRGKGEKILIVDDVVEQLEISSAILEKLGYATATVSNGEAALEYLSEVDADLILLDMVMEPGMDGLDTYKEILALRPAQKAVIASGFSETARVKEAMSLGARSYIKKPYTIEKIGVAVRDALDEEGPVIKKDTRYSKVLPFFVSS